MGIIGFLHRKRPELNDPEVIIDNALREMNHAQIRHRDMAVQLIAQKNNVERLYKGQLAECWRLVDRILIASREGSTQLRAALELELAERISVASTLASDVALAEENVKK